MNTPIRGNLTNAGTMQVAGEENRTGLFIAMTEEALRAVPSLPMYREVAVTVATDAKALDSHEATYQRMCEVEHELRAEVARLIREVGQLFIENGRLVARADLAEFRLKQSQKWDTVVIINARDEFQQRAEKAESELAGVHEARRAWLGDDYAHLEIGDALAKLRADTEAELAKERARLDWAESSRGLDWQTRTSWKVTRTTIDAAMKEDAPK